MGGTCNTIVYRVMKSHYFFSINLAKDMYASVIIELLFFPSCLVSFVFFLSVFPCARYGTLPTIGM